MKLFKANKKYVVVDFGSSEVKIIEGQATKGFINISKTSSIPLLSDLYQDGKILDRDTISRIIGYASKKDKINKNLHGIGVINSSSIITREVSIPKVSTSEIDPLLGYQISEFLPINPDNYVINHLVIDTVEIDQVEKLKLILIAIPKDIVLSHLELIKECDLKPEILDFQGNVIAKLLNYNTTINGSYSIRGNTIASIDMGNSSTYVSIIKNGNIEVTRTIDIGANTIYKSISQLLDFSIEEAKHKIKRIKDINLENQEYDEYHRIINLVRSSLESLMERIQSVTRYYTSRDQKNSIDLILLYGGLSNINRIGKIFSEYLGIETLKLESLDKVKFDGDLSLYANAIGGLIRRDGVKK